MSTNPFLTFFGMNIRANRYVEMFRRDALPTVGYQLWGADTVDNAYGNPLASGVGGSGPLPLFQMTRNQHFRSPGIQRRRLLLSEGNRKGQTHFAFDVEDYTGGVVPFDDQWIFLRTQENRNGVGLLDLAGVPADPALGPVFCLPPALWLGQESPSLVLTGTAPSGTLCALGVPPDYNEDLTSAAPRPLHLVMPLALTAVTVVNTAAGGGNNLLVCFGPDQPMVQIGPGQEIPFFSGRTKHIVLACPNAGGVSYRIQAVM